jgi:hypothetical protein
LVGGAYVPIVGSYDIDAPNRIHVEVNMVSKEYSICINDEEVVSDHPFEGDCADVKSLTFYVMPTILEAIPTELVVDDIRITK